MGWGFPSKRSRDFETGRMNAAMFLSARGDLCLLPALTRLEGKKKGLCISTFLLLPIPKAKEDKSQVKKEGSNSSISES